jgi:hypothetical protein
MLEKVYSLAGITNVDNEFLAKVGKYSGLVNVDKTQPHGNYANEYPS